MAKPSTRVRLRVSPGAWEVELPRRSLAIVSGQKTRAMVVLMEGIEAAETERRLEGAS